VSRSLHPRAVLFLTVFMDLVGFGIILPLLPIYAEDWGASSFANGLLIAIYSLMQFLFAPMWGHLSDRVGRRPIILISLFGSVLGYGLFGVASLFKSITLLFISRALAGVMGANIPVAQAYIADTTTPENRAHGMGLIGAAFGLGFVLGPTFAGIFIHFGQPGPGFGAAVICGLNLLLAAWRLPESLAPENRQREGVRESRLHRMLVAFRTPRVRALLWMFFVFTIGLSIWESFLPVFCGLRFGWTSKVIPWVFTYVGVLMSFTQGYLVRRLRKRMSETVLIRLGSTFSMLGLAMIAVTLSPWLHLVALAILAFGFGAFSPSLLGLLSRHVGATEQGRILGISQSLSSLARVLGPIAGYGLLGIAETTAGAAPRPHWVEAIPFVLAVVLVLGVMLAALAMPHQASPAAVEAESSPAA
jgi:DHA1 family tetracycline resistance protein-like MFS transporter